MKSIIFTYRYALVLATLAMASCEKFVTLPPPTGSVDDKVVYNSDETATAGIVGLYNVQGMRDFILNSALVAGLAADELQSGNFSDAAVQIQNNSVATNNSLVGGVWSNGFRAIRAANLAISGLENSTGVTPALRSQLLSEALFCRAYAFFVLVNLFDGVPLALSAESVDNAELPRASADDVWIQILSDLERAKELSSTEEITVHRTRVNRYAISALLARAYLYREQWEKSEKEADEVINSGKFILSEIGQNFKKISKETILQIFKPNGYAELAVEYLPASSTASTANYFLLRVFVEGFETNDVRKTTWIGNLPDGNNYIKKYLLRSGTAGDEYHVLFRLAEIHLIRAEARAQQNKLHGQNGAESDLNKIREHAGLGPKLNLSQGDMLIAIESERKNDLFGEWCHRWFDLKRQPSISSEGTRADDVLSKIKGENWQPTDVLMPIPAQQIELNPALEQNEGYKQ